MCKEFYTKVVHKIKIKIKMYNKVLVKALEWNESYFYDILQFFHLKTSTMKKRVKKKQFRPKNLLEKANYRSTLLLE